MGVQNRELSTCYVQSARLKLRSGRRLPAPPTNGTNGHTSPYVVQKGLPPEPRLARQLPSTSRPATANSNSGDIRTMAMPVPEVISPGNGDWHSSSEYSSGTVSRQPSARSGPPASSNGYDDPPTRSPSSLDDMYASPDGYIPQAASPEGLLSGYGSMEYM